MEVAEETIMRTENRVAWHLLFLRLVPLAIRAGPETSYESGENGHKIAFDPRDISESAERSKQPKLTLMEEVLLLGLKDKQVSSRKGLCSSTFA